jgi:hypothetical protein
MDSTNLMVVLRKLKDKRRVGRENELFLFDITSFFIRRIIPNFINLGN